MSLPELVELKAAMRAARQAARKQDSTIELVRSTSAALQDRVKHRERELRDKSAKLQRTLAEAKTAIEELEEVNRILGIGALENSFGEGSDSARGGESG